MYEVTNKYGNIGECFGLGKDIEEFFGALSDGLNIIEKYLGQINAHPPREEDMKREEEIMRNIWKDYPEDELKSVEKYLDKAKEEVRGLLAEKEKLENYIRSKEYKIVKKEWTHIVKNGREMKWARSNTAKMEE